MIDEWVAMMRSEVLVQAGETRSGGVHSNMTDDDDIVLHQLIAPVCC